MQKAAESAFYCLLVYAIWPLKCYGYNLLLIYNIPGTLLKSFLDLQVFSAFGFVHKITTFEKTAGFQVYILRKALDDDFSFSFFFSLF